MRIVACAVPTAVVIFWVYRDVAIGLLLGALLANPVLVYTAYRFTRRGQIGPAIFWSSMGHWLVGLVLAIGIPSFFAITGVQVMLPVAAAVSYVSRRVLAQMIGLAVAIVTTGAIVTMVAPFPPVTHPEWVNRAVVAAFVPGILGLCLLNLWQSGTRLREKNRALRKSERSLEAKVQARTAELREAKQRLERGNELIRRHVPRQLASQLLSGDYKEPEGPERRKLTLFFSDIKGFTPTADQLEPEELSNLLNEYLSEMADIANVYGATLNQFVGDGIMAFFGAPDVTNDRDHALRAVRMAVAMQERMAELGEKWFGEGLQTPLRIRIGINTGIASVGSYGSAGRVVYSAIGNQTNLAARIQEHCEPGHVLISHSTWGLVKDHIVWEERGEIEAKGIHYPVRVYDVKCVKPDPLSLA
jgi:class 3 adenylate cyclase